MRKALKIFKYIFGTGFLLFLITGLFIVDLGINSIFFIERDFNQAFQYRLTGSCENFLNYVNLDIEQWKTRCEDESGSDKEPIRDYKIQRISHDFLADRAFLQVELVRNTDEKDNYRYSVNYEMKNVDYKWKINKEIGEQ